jgi:hypothetical protein
MAKKKKPGFFEIFKEQRTYYNIFYLLLIFPLGIFSFIAVTALITISLALIAAPFLAPFTSFSIGEAMITSLPVKILVSLAMFIVGVFLLTLSLYLLSSLAEIYKRVLGFFD